MIYFSIFFIVKFLFSMRERSYQRHHLCFLVHDPFDHKEISSVWWIPAYRRQFCQFQTNESELLIKIQLWSGTRTPLARLIDSIHTHYNSHISQPQTNSVTTTEKPALSTAFKSQDWNAFSRIGNSDIPRLAWRQISGSVSHTCFSLYERCLTC